jgi:hypothetical protein
VVGMDADIIDFIGFCLTKLASHWLMVGIGAWYEWILRIIDFNGFRGQNE